MNSYEKMRYSQDLVQDFWTYQQYFHLKNIAGSSPIWLLIINSLMSWSSKFEQRLVGKASPYRYIRQPDSKITKPNAGAFFTPEGAILGDPLHKKRAARKKTISLKKWEIQMEVCLVKGERWGLERCKHLQRATCVYIYSLCLL